MNKKTKTKNRKMIFRLNVAFALILVGSLFTHLVIANHAANQRYAVQQYLKEYESLRMEAQRLSVTAAELRSSERLLEESERLQLVAADTIHYIAPKGSVALSQ